MFTKMHVKQWYSGVLTRPLELIVGLSIFTTVAAGGVVRHAASTAFSVLLVISFFYVRSWPETWRQLTSAERLVLIGFGLYFISALLSYYNVSDEHEYINHLGKYARFLVIVPIYLLLSRANLKLFPYLLAGAIIAGPLYFGAALLSITERPGFPAQGYYHHITFGDTAMLAGLFLTTVLMIMKMSRVMKIVLLVSITCLLYSSVLSQARGAWLALPVCLFLLLVFAVRHSKINVRALVIALVIFGALLVMSPANEIISNRVQKAVNEIESFQNDNAYRSSVGSRLSMWHIAINTWYKHPLIGTGPGDFDLEMRAAKAEGLYLHNFEHSSTHNIFFQALATTGTVGLVVLCFALFILPFRFFYKSERSSDNVASYSGMVVLTAFAVFGLTESWTLRSPAVSVYLLYFVTLATTVSRKAGA